MLLGLEVEGEKPPIMKTRARMTAPREQVMTRPQKRAEKEEEEEEEGWLRLRPLFAEPRPRYWLVIFL